MGRSKQKIITQVVIACGAILFLFGLVNFINKRVEDGNRNPPTSDEIMAEYRKINVYKEDREVDPVKVIAKSGMMIARAHYETDKSEEYLGDYYTKEMKKAGYSPTENGKNPTGERYFKFSSGRYLAILQFNRDNGGLIYYLGIESEG